jgi:hypothetical protein
MKSKSNSRTAEARADSLQRRVMPKPNYKIMWGAVKPEAIAAMRKESAKQTEGFLPFDGETPEQFAARVWSCGFLYAREYYAEQVALRQAGWPDVNGHNDQAHAPATKDHE